MLPYLLSQESRKRPAAAAARVYTMTTPIGGWNARDALQAMHPRDAVVLDNVIPAPGRMIMRPGYTTFASELEDDHVETLMEYAPPNGDNKLFAATPSAIYDVTAGGTATTAAVNSLTNARWQHTMFSTLGGNFLCAVNGDDGYYVYDGTEWLDKSGDITFGMGVSTTVDEFIHIARHASRLWFVKKQSLTCYYLPSGQITGECAEFDLGPLCRRGGYLLAIGSWTKDGGSGMDDLWVAVTSKGEVIVFEGTDPDQADTWSLVGVFEISEPIGRRCLIKVGGDIGILTSTGLAQLSQMIGTNRSGQGKIAITNKISGAFASAYRQSGTMHGWQVIEFPKMSLVMVNVPANNERSTSFQFVVNVETGGWCRFTGMDANCWGMLGTDMFFGTSAGTVCKFGDALDDDGNPITFTIQTAYNRLGTNAVKAVKMVRPLMRAADGYSPGVIVLVDYEDSRVPDDVPAAVEIGGAVWDEAEWDEALWGGALVKSDVWQTVIGEGRAISVVLHGSIAGISFEFNEIDVMFEPGGFL